MVRKKERREKGRKCSVLHTPEFLLGKKRGEILIRRLATQDGISPRQGEREKGTHLI